MLTIVTVTYQDPSDTLKLLEDLCAQTNIQFTLILVDNASNEEYRERLTKATHATPFPCHTIWSSINSGYAGGVNQGITLARTLNSDWILILNNDVRLEPTCIELLIRRIAGEQPGLLGIPISERGNRVVCGSLSWLRTTLTHQTYATSNAYIIGAAILIDRATMEALGPMDERYFLYFEDAEYTLRARTKGIRIDFLPEPTILHTPSRSTSNLSSHILLRYHVRNAILLNSTYGPWWVRIVLPFWTSSILARNVVKYLLFPSKRRNAQALIYGVLDAYHNRYGKIA
jgi:GT2 family glycosyltransferase